MSPSPRRARLPVLAAVAATAGALALDGRFEWPWTLLGWIALVPWLSVLDRTETLRGAIGAGLLMSAAFTLALFTWFASAIEEYAGVPWAAGMLALLLLSPVIEPQFVAFAMARYVARRRASFWYTTLTGACVYTGTEWLVPKLFADTLGHGFYPSAVMRQAADLAGAPGLTFVLVLANECARAVSRSIPRSPSPNPQPPPPRHTAAACFAALVLGLFGYGTLRLRQIEAANSNEAPVTAGIVQADISRYGALAATLGKFEAVQMILDTHFALSTEVSRQAKLDFLLWPETVYPTTFGLPKSAEGAEFDRAIGAFVAGAGVPLIFGAYDAEDNREFNAAVFLEPSPDGRLVFDTYRKVWLFPLTEYVPAPLDFLRPWLPWLGGWTPGEGPKAMPLRLPDGRVLRAAPLICYDAIDPGHTLAAVRQGAEVIVTMSNDSWFAFGAGPRAHLILSAFRSIESRRPQVRATTTGISAVISPTGEIIRTIGIHDRATLAASVTPRRTWTLMIAWGDWFGPTALACGLVLLASAGRLPRRLRGTPQPLAELKKFAEEIC